MQIEFGLLTLVLMVNFSQHVRPIKQSKFGRLKMEFAEQLSTELIQEQLDR